MVGQATNFQWTIIGSQARRFSCLLYMVVVQRWWWFFLDLHSRDFLANWLVEVRSERELNTNNKEEKKKIVIKH